MKSIFVQLSRIIAFIQSSNTQLQKMLVGCVWPSTLIIPISRPENWFLEQFEKDKSASVEFGRVEGYCFVEPIPGTEDESFCHGGGMDGDVGHAS